MKRQEQWLLKEKYNNKPTKQFYKDIERLNRGEPLDYVIGFTEFLGCKIDLSKKPLIPRPETEFWVGKAIKDILIFSRISEYKKIKVLDLFAGSGCIGIAILNHIKDCHVAFADNNPNCIAQIKINLKPNNALIRANKGYTKSFRYVVVKSDIFSNIKGRFDFIFANPPYISVKNKSKIQKSVLEYEPKSALFGGGDGLFYIRKFLADAKNFLNPGGKIFMEFSPEQKKSIEKLFTRQNFSRKNFGGRAYKNWEFHKDQYNKWRWVVVFR